MPRRSVRIIGRASSINVRKVMWTCDEAGLAWTREEWKGGVGPMADPEFLAMNPNGLVPVVIDEHGPLWESNTICRYLAVKAAFSTWLADKALKTIIAGLINGNMTYHLENNTFRRLLGESPLLGKFLLEGFYAGVTEHLLSKCTRCNIYSRGQMCPCCLSTSTLQGNKKQIRFLKVTTPSVDQVRSKDSSDL